MLVADGGWVVLDFEGEPARALLERRRKRSPLRDVAGMLRSFAYAASAARAPARGRRARGLGGRARALPRRVLRDRGPVPAAARPGRDERLLAVFELEKAVYELRYELDNRPDWVAIPVAGIARLLEEPVHEPRHPAQGHRAARRPRPRDPHALLGAHPDDGGVVVRAFRPDAERVTACAPRPPTSSSSASTRPGSSRAAPGGAGCRCATSSRSRYPDGLASRARDPYAFPPTIGEVDLHLAGEGRHEELYESLGAHAREVDGAAGTAFAVWAPSARSVSVVGDFNSWDGRLHPMRSLGLDRDLGALPARRRGGLALQVRDPRAVRRAAR